MILPLRNDYKPCTRTEQGENGFVEDRHRLCWTVWRKK